MANKSKYNNKRARILLKGLIPSLIGIFLPKIKKRIIFNSTRNEFYNFNSKYLFKYFLDNHKEYDCKFVINDKAKRDKLNKEYGNNYFIETESLKGMLFALRAKTWVTSAFETPVGGIFLNLNRFVFLLGHGTHFKAIVFNESNLSTIKKYYYYIIRFNFSKYLVTSKALIEVYKKAYKCSKNKLAVLGEPRHDKIYQPNTSLFEDGFGENILKENNILYAPTWRPYGELKLFPFNKLEWDTLTDYLEENNINIYLRMHPSFQENLQFYTKKTSRIKILDNSVIEDISDVMDCFDLLITDYSSIFISFLLLNKPVLFLPYDIEIYKAEVGFIKPYEELTPGPKPKSLTEFQEEIIKLLNDKNYYSKDREIASEFFNDYKLDNCKMNADFIINNL